jgi:hypothetical protein
MRDALVHAVTCLAVRATLSRVCSQLNLIRANHVLVLDGWWNPAVTEQAIDRAHRITQTRAVHVHMLYAHNTFDEVIRDVAARKAREAQALLGDPEQQQMLGGDAARSSSTPPRHRTRSVHRCRSAAVACACTCACR